MESLPLIPPDQNKDLIKLSSSVWLRPPTVPSDRQPPHFVVLCGWLEASLRHVTKYAQGYASILPSSTILIVHSTVVDALTPWNMDWHRRRLEPVVDMIRRAVNVEVTGAEERPSLIVQAFSNAGLGTAWLLVSYLSELNILRSVLTGMVFDSCPGSGGYLSTVNAFRVASNAHTMSYYSPLRLLIEAAAHTGVYITHSLVPYLAGARGNVVELARLGFNDPDLIGLQVPKLYFYSKSDTLIAWHDITEHVTDSDKKGYRADIEVFENTGHCGHLVADPDKYWAAVTKTAEQGESARR
ncbi:hypothetical protein CC79DRAFT_1368433 [Sarocladium strictum]